MALPGSGTITWEMIRAQFGGGYPIYMSQYYRGGGLVPNIAANANVPTSGSISAWHFYNATNYVPLGGYNSPSSISSETTSTSTSHNITGQGTSGTGSYSYSWSLVSNTGGYSLSNASSQTCTISRSGLVINATYLVTARCTISDGVSSVTVDTPVSIKRVNPAG